MAKRFISIILLVLILAGCVQTQADSTNTSSPPPKTNPDLAKTILDAVGTAMTMPEGAVTYNILDPIEGLEDVTFTGIISSSEGYETLVLTHKGQPIYLKGSRGSTFTLQDKTFKISSLAVRQNKVVLYEQLPREEKEVKDKVK